MKKFNGQSILCAVLLLLLAALLSAAPLQAAVLTDLTDAELADVTGQSGVSIGADVSMNLSFDTVAWGDPDGLHSGATDTTGAVIDAIHDTNSVDGGWVGIRNLAINNLRIHLRSDNGMIDPSVAVQLNTAYTLGGTFTDATSFLLALSSNDVAAWKAGLLSSLATEQLLTIDIYTAAAKTYVRIGLPTFEITMGSMTMDVGLASNLASGLPNTTQWQSMGQIYMGGLQVLVDKNNYVDISQNNTTQGVLIHIGNTGAGNLAQVGFTSLSWGDPDGLNAWSTNAPGAGFVGLRGMSLSFTMNMDMNINVGTATGAGMPSLLSSMAAVTDLTSLGAFKTTLMTGLAQNSPQLKDSLAYILHTQGIISATSVDIALSGSVGISRMVTQVRLADNAPLAGTSGGPPGANAGVLSENYIGGLQLTILGNAATGSGSGAAPQSWVSISAH